MTPRDDHIRTCQNQVIRHLVDAPEKAVSTALISGTVSEGLQCQVSQGQHRVAMDLGKTMGGDGTAPSPSFFAKAGLVGCLAIATKMTAARAGLNIRSVHVEIETDTDTLAMFGLGGGSAAPLDTRIEITIDSDEDDIVIDALIDQVLVIDTWFLALRDAQPVSIDWTRKAKAA